MTPDEERRGHERRIETLEKAYVHLQQAVQRVEVETEHMKEMLKSNFRALEKGQDLLVSEMRGFTTLIQTLTASADASPGGKQLLREIAFVERARLEDRGRLDTLEGLGDTVGKHYERQAIELATQTGRLDTLETQVEDLVAGKNRILGAIWLAGAGWLTAAWALLRSFGKP